MISIILLYVAALLALFAEEKIANAFASGAAAIAVGSVDLTRLIADLINKGSSKSHTKYVVYVNGVKSGGVFSENGMFIILVFIFICGISLTIYVKLLGALSKRIIKEESNNQTAALVLAVIAGLIIAALGIYRLALSLPHGAIWDILLAAALIAAGGFEIKTAVKNKR